MRRIGVVTTSRADYGIYLPVLKTIQADSELELHLIVAGMHLLPEFGMTVNEIESDGFEISDRVEIDLSIDSPQDIARSMGLGTVGFAESFACCRPDILVVLGDRFEMHAGAVAALPFNIPVAHIHGGELTLGAIDDCLRHSMTKLAHLHFVSCEECARRVIQLGENPWRVTVSGAPSLDNLRETELMSDDEFTERFGVSLADTFLLVTQHPTTLEYEQTEWHITELLAAIEESGLPALFAMPNADTGHRVIAWKIREFVDANPSAHVVDNLGTRGWFSAMAAAAAMVGNSSSGIIEAASFELPVVNVGSRQGGRVRGENVIDVDYGRGSILEGIARAIDSEFRARLRGMSNPYVYGNASERIVETLKQIEIDDRLLIKRFHDFPDAREDGDG